MLCYCILKANNLSHAKVGSSQDPKHNSSIALVSKGGLTDSQGYMAGTETTIKYTMPLHSGQQIESEGRV